MKKILYSAIIFLAFFVSACKKNSSPAPVNLGGTSWTGTCNVPGLSLTNKAFQLSFNADGTLTGSLTNGTAFTLDGTWNLIPNSVTVHIFFTLQTVSGSYVGQGTLTTNNTKIESGVATNATTPSTNLNFTVTKS